MGRALATACCLLLALSACTKGGGPEVDPEPLDAPWVHASDPVDTDGLAYAVGHEVHLPDGTVVDTGSDLVTFVVAGDGVFFVAADDPEDVGSPGRASGELRFADPSGAVTSTGVTISSDSLRASPSGRYVGGIDWESGPTDDFGTPTARLRVWDLQEGRVAVDTTDGLGDPGSDDLAVLYEDVRVEVLRLDDEGAWVLGAEDLVHELPSGGSRAMADDDPARDGDGDRLTSPDGSARIGTDGGHDAVLVEGEEPWVPRAPGKRWGLTWWVDGSTLLGRWIEGPGRGDEMAARDELTMMTCAYPEGTCRPLPGTTQVVVVFPAGSPSASRRPANLP